MSVFICSGQMFDPLKLDRDLYVGVYSILVHRRFDKSGTIIVGMGEEECVCRLTRRCARSNLPHVHRKVVFNFHLNTS